MDGVFIVGIDTGVGKTALAAGLVKMFQGKKAVYWKPVQTATIVSDDTSQVKSLLEGTPDSVLDPMYRFAEPLSPYMAAQKWGKKISLDDLGARLDELRSKGNFMVIEGSGGLCSPFAEGVLQADWIKRSKLPVLLVAEDRVGAINQVCLSAEYIRKHSLPLLGVVLTRARRTFGNAECMRIFASVDVIAELDPSEDTNNLVAQVSTNDNLRKLFGFSKIPA